MDDCCLKNCKVSSLSTKFFASLVFEELNKFPLFCFLNKIKGLEIIASLFDWRNKFLLKNTFVQSQVTFDRGVTKLTRL